MEGRDKIEITIRAASIAKLVLGVTEINDFNLSRLALRQALIESMDFDKWLEGKEARLNKETAQRA